MPASRASTSAFSSTTGPRAVLMRIAVGFMTASSAAPMRWRVDSFKGTCRLTMSERLSNSGSAGTNPLRPVSWRVVWMTSMSNPDALCATARAMRPKPTSPSVAPCTSRARCVPNPQPPHRPSRRSRSASEARPRRREDQEEREVRRRVIEDSRCVAHRDAHLGGRCDVDVVVPDRGVCHHTQSPGPSRFEDGCVDPVREVAHDAVEVRGQPRQIPRRERCAGVGFHDLDARLEEWIGAALGQWACDEDA